MLLNAKSGLKHIYHAPDGMKLCKNDIIVYFAGSFNPVHKGHIAIIEKGCHLIAKKHHLFPKVVVAIKSDERLTVKMKKVAQPSFIINYEERKSLVKLLWEEMYSNNAMLKNNLYFDDNFRHFGDATHIRMTTELYYASKGVQVFRLLGEDSVQKYNLQNDSTVITAIRYGYNHESSGGLVVDQSDNQSSTKIRKLLHERKYGEIDLPLSVLKCLLNICKKSNNY
eukprot:119014_1